MFRDSYLSSAIGERGRISNIHSFHLICIYLGKYICVYTTVRPNTLASPSFPFVRTFLLEYSYFLLKWIFVVILCNNLPSCALYMLQYLRDDFFFAVNWRKEMLRRSMLSVMNLNKKLLIENEEVGEDFKRYVEQFSTVIL